MEQKKIQTIIKVGASSYVLVPTDVKRNLDVDNGEDLIITYGNVNEPTI